MLDNDIQTLLFQAIDMPAASYERLDRYYEGCSPLSYLAPEAVAALGDRLRRISVNVPKVLVDSIAERLRVTAIAGADVWDDWQRLDLDQLSDMTHREALILGTSYLTVWAGVDGRPQVSVESARQMSMLVDPGSREPIAAAKRWNTATTTEAVIYRPDRIERLRANSSGATTAGFELVGVIDNPLGVLPVVQFSNMSRIVDNSLLWNDARIFRILGRSEMADVIDLTDAVTKLLTDMMVASEVTARPRRWSTGVELTEDADGNVISPFTETMKMLIAESDAAKFGQLPGADLAGYENAIGVLMRMISAVSGLPEHLLGIGGDNPTSADSIRASEAALTAKAEARQQMFGRSHEQVARLIVAVRDGVAPDSVQPRVQWADAATRSTAQEADATVKLFQAGLLSREYALAKLGYSADDIAANIAAAPVPVVA
ncbi:phage portal protein [Mycolicibacterium sp. NCC-Tsukiji]|uniref:phage portal protein n=1 Tax=Mycolicibacterium sp. NCC-Tsukiji TaxID=2185272 RepID=UPI000EC1209F|nr:phage portal protein [Mycolicibacterium sp. NCC-Tsukiji]GCA97170.1 hypothetical protein NCCNTM_08050 [Mycolicibacterium sp. NCC-Tsukiji]